LLWSIEVSKVIWQRAASPPHTQICIVTIFFNGFTMGRHMPPQSVCTLYFVLYSNCLLGIWTTHLLQGSLGSSAECPLSGISICSTVFAGFTSVPNTERDTVHNACDMCSNRPQYLHAACGRCGLKHLINLLSTGWVKKVSC